MVLHLMKPNCEEGGRNVRRVDACIPAKDCAALALVADLRPAASERLCPCSLLPKRACPHPWPKRRRSPPPPLLCPPPHTPHTHTHLLLARHHQPLVPLRILRHLNGVPLPAPRRAAVHAAPRGGPRGGQPAGRTAAAGARRGGGVAGVRAAARGPRHGDWWRGASLWGAHDDLVRSMRE